MLKQIEESFKVESWKGGDLTARSEVLKARLVDIQFQLDLNPFDDDLREAETNISREYRANRLEKERLLKQKAEVHWLKVGDREAMTNHFVEFYKGLLGKTDFCDKFVDLEGYANRVDSFVASDMIREVSVEKIKGVIFSMGNDKAYGQMVTLRKLLKEVNATLIPKTDHPTVVGESRPIALCNVLYKCIAKIIANRIKGCLGDLVDNTQNAFVPGRRINDNILLTQEIMKNYHRKVGSPSAADPYSVQILKDSLDEFGICSGLWPNKTKSNIFSGASKGKDKVAWKDVCVPKIEGGLGLKALRCWNKDIAEMGLSIFARPVDFVIDGDVVWPEELLLKIPQLNSERNKRLFQGMRKKEWQIITYIEDDVKKKLMGCGWGDVELVDRGGMGLFFWVGFGCIEKDVVVGFFEGRSKRRGCSCWSGWFGLVPDRSLDLALVLGVYGKLGKGSGVRLGFKLGGQHFHVKKDRLTMFQGESSFASMPYSNRYLTHQLIFDKEKETGTQDGEGLYLRSIILDKEEEPQNPKPPTPATSQINNNMSSPHKPMKVAISVAGKSEKMIDKDKKDYTPGDLSYIMKDAEVKCQGTTAIKKNRKTLLTQEYEHFDSRDNESLAEIYERFQKLLNDLSLANKEYDLEDSNLKFILAIPEK
ncbi:hypothetical protein AgCh_035297 [Apium graveolens]